MGMNPDPYKLFRSPSLSNLIFKEIRHRVIVEYDRDGSSFLPHEDDILDQQQVIRSADPEAPDFCRSHIPEEQQLRPRRRTES